MLDEINYLGSMTDNEMNFRRTLLFQANLLSKSIIIMILVYINLYI